MLIISCKALSSFPRVNWSGATGSARMRRPARQCFALIRTGTVSGTRQTSIDGLLADSGQCLPGGRADVRIRVARLDCPQLRGGVFRGAARLEQRHNRLPTHFRIAIVKCGDQRRRRPRIAVADIAEFGNGLFADAHIWALQGLNPMGDWLAAAERGGRAFVAGSANSKGKAENS